VPGSGVGAISDKTRREGADRRFREARGRELSLETDGRPQDAGPVRGANSGDSGDRAGRGRSVSGSGGSIAAIGLTLAALAAGPVGLAVAQPPAAQVGEVVPREVRQIYDRGLQFLAGSRSWPRARTPTSGSTAATSARP
jgi:hypothetical protein